MLLCAACGELRARARTAGTTGRRGRVGWEGRFARDGAGVARTSTTSSPWPTKWVVDPSCGFAAMMLAERHGVNRAVPGSAQLRQLGQPFRASFALVSDPSDRRSMAPFGGETQPRDHVREHHITGLQPTSRSTGGRTGDRWPCTARSPARPTESTPRSTAMRRPRPNRTPETLSAPPGTFQSARIFRHRNTFRATRKSSTVDSRDQ